MVTAISIPKLKQPNYLTKGYVNAKMVKEGWIVGRLAEDGGGVTSVDTLACVIKTLASIVTLRCDAVLFFVYLLLNIN